MCSCQRIKFVNYDECIVAGKEMRTTQADELDTIGVHKGLL